MDSIRLVDALAALQSHSRDLGNLTVQQFFGLAALFSQLRPTISWYGIEDTDDLEEAPATLPAHIEGFLRDTMPARTRTIRACWDVLRSSIWQGIDHNVIDSFVMHGPEFHLAYKNFFPPTRVCVNDNCRFYRNTGRKNALTDPSQIPSTYFTTEGAIPVYTTSLYCRGCHSTYFLNYVRSKDAGGQEARVFYGDVPAVIQAEKHIFVQDKLCALFKEQAVFTHASAQGIARVYNRSLADLPNRPADWQTPFELRSDVVSDIFNLYALLQHHCEIQTRLVLPEHADGQYDRLKSAMQRRNRAMVGTGQEHWAHRCDACMFIKEENGRASYFTVALSDGVAVGHASCQVHNCATDLPSNRAHFCSEHADRSSLCCVEACEERRQEGYRTCIDATHRAMEDSYIARGKAMFQLKARKERRENASSTNAKALVDEDEDVIEVECAGKSNEGNRKLRARFGRRRTHNEQLIVRPCGIILARATFFGAEGITDVARMMEAVWPTEASVPGYIYYDTGCILYRILKDHPHFKNTSFPVDVFHFDNKHKADDTFCDEHSNPGNFPELFRDGEWLFNSSAAEQVNAWFGPFQCIVREMLPVRYNFYLDEMIKVRNRWLVGELEKRGLYPSLIPTSVLFP